MSPTPTTIDPTSLTCIVGGKPWGSDALEPLPVVNPADGSQVRTVPEAGADGAAAAVESAVEGFDVWRRQTPKERAEALFRLAEAIEQRADDFAYLETTDVGKPLAAARAEMVGSADKYRFYAGVGRSMSGVAATEYKAGITSIVRREPIGVVAALAPWNYPMALTAWKIAPPLMAGNAVVLKPSPESPMTAMLLGEIAAEILPPGVLNVITGGPVTGEALCLHPAVGMLSLTGGTPTGKKVMELASRGLKRVHLELGGKAPVVVFDDADLERLTKSIRVGSFWNGGQDCTCASRLYVSPARHEEVVGVLSSMAEGLEIGDPMAEQAPDMGPLVSFAHRDRVSGFVERAVEGGHAEVAAGGVNGDDTGAFYRPTIVVGVEQRDEIVQQEIFGPVLSVLTYEDERQAVAAANDVSFGLAASVWSQDIDRAMRVANEVRAGTVWVNEHGPTMAEMPFGGFKESGMGRDNSIFSIEEHTELKHVAIAVKPAG
ncbi:MAG: aldehyde dehydrogenase family protein [Solirubrobacterales bacterium]